MTRHWNGAKMPFNYISDKPNGVDRGIVGLDGRLQRAGVCCELASPQTEPDPGAASEKEQRRYCVCWIR